MICISRADCPNIQILESTGLHIRTNTWKGILAKHSNKKRGMAFLLALSTGKDKNLVFVN